MLLDSNLVHFFLLLFSKTTLLQLGVCKWRNKAIRLAGRVVIMNLSQSLCVASLLMHGQFWEKQDAKDTHGKLVFLSGYLCGSLRVFHSLCLPRVQISLDLLMCWFALLWTRKILIRHFQRHQPTSNSGVHRSFVDMWFMVCRWSLSAIESLTISRLRLTTPLTMYSVS